MPWKKAYQLIARIHDLREVRVLEDFHLCWDTTLAVCDFRYAVYTHIYIYTHTHIPEVRDDEASSQAQPPMFIQTYSNIDLLPSWGWLWVSPFSQWRRGPSQVLDSRLALYTLGKLAPDARHFSVKVMNFLSICSSCSCGRCVLHHYSSEKLEMCHWLCHSIGNVGGLAGLGPSRDQLTLNSALYALRPGIWTDCPMFWAMVIAWDVHLLFDAFCSEPLCDRRPESAVSKNGRGLGQARSDDDVTFGTFRTCREVNKAGPFGLLWRGCKLDSYYWWPILFYLQRWSDGIQLTCQSNKIWRVVQSTFYAGCGFLLHFIFDPNKLDANHDEVFSDRSQKPTSKVAECSHTSWGATMLWSYYLLPRLRKNMPEIVSFRKWIVEA